MKQSHFIVNLKRQFASDVWPWLAMTLKQDSLIWESLENTNLGERALAEFGDDPAMWTPATLALLEMHDADLWESLVTEPIQPVSGPLRRMADQAFQEWQKQPESTSIRLAQAGLIALALREQRILNDTWENLDVELISPENIHTQSTKTAMACLYGMLPDPLELITALLNCAQPNRSSKLTLRDVAKLANHILLSNPIPPDAQNEVLFSLFLELTPKQRLYMLEELKIQRPQAFEQLVARLDTQADRSITSATLGELIEIDGYLENLGNLVLSAETNRLGSQPALAVPLLVESLKNSRQIQAKVAANLGQISSQLGDLINAVDYWKQAAQLAPGNPTYIANLALALLKDERSEDAKAYLTAKQVDASLQQHPELLLAEAWIVYRMGDPTTAETDALKILRLFQSNDPSLFFDTAEPRIEFLKSFAHLLFELNQFKETSNIAQAGLDDYPSNIDLLKIFVQAQFALEQPAEALNAIHLAIVLQPEDTKLRSMLVDCLESAGEWPAALNERSSILAASEDHTAEDLHDYAYCALQAGEPQKAIQTCQEAIQIDPENGLIYGLLGQANFALGDYDQALDCFQSATQFAPQEEAPWLAFAQAYKQMQQTTQAIEILRKASLAVPNSPLIHLALGEACIEENAPTQALNSLRQAASLLRPKDQFIPQENIEATKNISQGDYPPGLASRIALQLGKTLYNLGHLDEARQVLEQAYERDSEDPALAYAYSKTILDAGEYEKAIAPLEVVVQAQPDALLPYLEYARVLLKAGGQAKDVTERTIAVLNHVLDSTKKESREFEEAISLLAEAFAVAGDLPKSRDIYRQALDTELAQDPSWRARLAHGLGRVTLALKEYETAIAALQEANQADPQDPHIQRSLSEAYLATGLIVDAFQAAHAMLRLNPSDIDTLAWFADQALHLSELPGGAQLPAKADAIQALKRAVQLAPNRSDLILKLGQTQQQTGNPKAVRETLSKLITIEDIQQSDLFIAAKILRELDAPGLAIELLERAVSLEPEARPTEEHQDAPALIELLVELANAHRQVGDVQAALQTLDKALAIESSRPILYVIKTDLLMASGQPIEALECIQTALELEPTNSDLHLRTARIYRIIGELPCGSSAR